MKRRIFQVVNTLAYTDGGPARHALEVNFALNAAGVPIQLLAINPINSPSLLDEVKERRDFPVLSPRNIRRTPRQLWTDLVDVAHADRIIVHGYYLWWIPVALTLAQARRIPVLIMPHGSLTKFDRSKSRLKKTVFRYFCLGWMVDRLAHFVVASEVEKNELPSSVARNRVSVVGAGAERVEIDARLETHAPVRLITLSRMSPKKRIDLCIESVAELRAIGVDADLYVVGNGDPDYETSLRTLADHLRVADYVHFMGHKSGHEKAELLRASDIFLLPSDDENFGLAFAEASMFGLPSVVSDRVGAATSLPPSAGARLSKPTPVAIAEAVKDLLVDYPLASKETRAFAEHEFSWSVVATRWERAIRRPPNGDTDWSAR